MMKVVYNKGVYVIWIGLFLFLSGCSDDLPVELREYQEQLPEEISYNFHIKPILSDRCFACHGPDEARRESGLRLDDPVSSFAAMQDHPALVAIKPGSPSQSELYARIMSDDPEEIMPPPSSKLQLTELEKALLYRWISEGAEYENHWSFQALHDVEVPKQPFEEWGNNAIDDFIGQKLQEKGLNPSPEAERNILFRRLSFDLTGLPPSWKDSRSFVANDDPNAYGKLVDSLLADNSYGERMAADWLDVARYADSDGYLDDKHRSLSPYRDWVIKAFNENMPYDQFVTWQLAGDLLPDATQEQILATAFNRLHKKNSEAGIVFEEYRVEYVADRTHTFSKAFLGLSVECARCHDHKYDPISQEDYYGLFGFFNSTNEFGSPAYGPDQTPGPALLLTSEEEEDIIDFLEEKIATGEAQANQMIQTADKDFEAWVESADLESELKTGIATGLVCYQDFDQMRKKDEKTWIDDNPADPLKPARIREPVLGEGVTGDAFYIGDYSTVALGEKVGWFERTDPFTVDLWIYLPQFYEEAGIFTHCEDIRLGYKGYSLHLKDNRLRFIMAHSWPQNAVELLSTAPLEENEWTHVSITYDGSSRADGVKLFVNGKAAQCEIVADHLYKGILYRPDIHTYGFRGFALGYRDKIKTLKGGAIDELKLFDRALTEIEVMYHHNPGKAGELISTQVGKDQLLAFYHDRNNRDLIKVREKLHSERNHLNRLMDTIPEIMVMGDLDQPRPTYLLDRGDYAARSREVELHTPEAVFAFNEQFTDDRLGLANWLFDPENPLTARVFVNRIWQMHFGTGLVKTAEDFGAQGDLPTHPELLDWLARYFMENDWDIKKLHKLIVTSTTYRQSSVVSEEHLALDPENKWLARAPGPRLTAEMIRDQALAVSGLLVREVGGPSVYPYQPAGLWDELSNKSWRYPYLQEPGDGLYRRSIYSIFKRTSPPPAMLIFDVPDRSTCTVRRTSTSTPLQALVTLNDPQFIEASRVLAERIVRTTDDPQNQVYMAFTSLTGREPDTEETSDLLHFYETEKAKWQNRPDAALAYLSEGEMPWDKTLDRIDLTALAITCSSIMNTADAQTRR